MFIQKNDVVLIYYTGFIDFDKSKFCNKRRGIINTWSGMNYVAETSNQVMRSNLNIRLI